MRIDRISSHADELVSDVQIPDKQLAREITEVVRGTETELLVDPSSRVYLFGSLTGRQRGLRYNPELLYAGAIFHDLGLMESHSSPADRFEIDGANAVDPFSKREVLVQQSVTRSGLP